MVRQVGFDLSDTYVEQCWSPVVRRSAILLLRRMPELWRQEVPARISASELGRSIGLGAGTGPNSRLVATTERLVHFGLARSGGGPDELDVFLEVGPLRGRQLERVPQWPRDTHERLLTAHLEGFEGVGARRARVAGAAAGLDRFRGRVRSNSTPARASQALGR